MTQSPEDYEKLGAFYLGKAYDVEHSRVLEEPLLYDAKDLTTHAVCVGMTGSGKTGLCVTLLEEAAIDGIPSIVVDMKGDLANLLLTFPDLEPDDFLPWIEPAEATRKGHTVEEHARTTAALWKSGLASWQQTPDRIERFREAVDFGLYTPGSDAGRPLTVLRSFAAPPPALVKDGDAFRERINAAVQGLLTLMGIDADPVQSREHILLANILDHAWRAGEDVDIGEMIRRIQSPPFDEIGFFDLDTFFPASRRLQLAITLNNLVASPGFSAWTRGDPLDVSRLLWTDKGKPRVSIVSIAHLSDSERMFFLTVLLNEIGSWMRTQSGTSGLRALLYIDEVFGYLPPTANPPTKIPLLTLLKQARAFGLGVVLATQNPVDLDYKALSNAGTWFLGRLQTERDKLRVIDGLEGASSAAGVSFDRARMEALLGGLSSRVFLMNNVHDDEPAVFHTRWALSYLRGPLTRDHVKKLSSTLAPPVPPAPPEPPAARMVTEEPEVDERPALPDGISEAFLGAATPNGGRLVYRPALAATAALHYASARVGLDLWTDVQMLAPLTDAGDPWENAIEVDGLTDSLRSEPEDGITFSELPRAAGRKTSYRTWSKMLKTRLHRHRELTTWKCSSPREASKPGETESEFRARMNALLREKRDTEVEKLEKRHASKRAKLEDRARRAQERVEREQAQYEQQKASTAISIGATLLGALLGRKLGSAGNVRRAASSARSASRAAREKDDIARARENLAAQEEKLRELDAELEEKVAELRAQEPDLEIVEVPLRPRKTDLNVGEPTVVWTPWVVSKDGMAEPAYEL